jgi:hypothetical protein
MTMSPMRRRRIRRTFGVEPGLILGGSFRFNGGLVDQHDRNIVLDTVDAEAAEALQGFLVCGQLDFGLAQRTGEDLEELGIKRHGGLLNVVGAAILYQISADGQPHIGIEKNFPVVYFAGGERWT